MSLDKIEARLRRLEALVEVEARAKALEESRAIRAMFTHATEEEEAVLLRMVMKQNRKDHGKLPGLDRGAVRG